MLQQVLVCQEIQESDSQHTEFVLLAMNVITNNDKVFRVLFFDIGITFYTAKIMVLSQNPAQSMKKLRLSSKKTAKCCIVNYIKNVF